jgi:hypothetical protein
MRLRIFAFFLTLYLATTAGHIYTIDSYLNYTVTRSIGSHHKLSVPRSMMTVEGRSGRQYSKLGIGQSLTNLPMYYAGSIVEMLFPGRLVFKAYSGHVYIPHETRPVKSEAQTLIRISDVDGGRVFFTALTNAFVVAAVCLIFFMSLGAFGVCARGSLLGALILGLATPFWVYSRDLFGEPLFALSLLGTFYFLAAPDKPATPRRAALAGVFSSIGVLTRMSFAPVVAIFALYLVFSPGKRGERSDLALKYILFSLPGLVVVGVLNWVRFESVFASGYHTAFDKGFSVPLLEGVVYNLFRPYRSIFLYAPPVIVSFFGIAHFARRFRTRLVLIALIVVYMFVLYSKWWAWHGGWCWGPRFYLPIVPLVMLPGLVYIRLAGNRALWWAAIALAVAGFAVQLGAVLVNYTMAYDYWIKVGKLDWSETDIHLFSPITTHWKAILSTSPLQYDLWLIQAAREAWPASVAIMAALAVAGILVGRQLKNRIGIPARSDCAE